MPETDAQFWARSTPENYDSLSVGDLAALLRYWQAFPLNRANALEQSSMHASDVRVFTDRAFQILCMAAEQRGIDTTAIGIVAGEYSQSSPKFDRLLIKLQTEASKAPNDPYYPARHYAGKVTAESLRKAKSDPTKKLATIPPHSPGNPTGDPRYRDADVRKLWPGKFTKA